MQLSGPSFSTYAVSDSMVADFSGSSLSAEFKIIKGRIEGDMHRYEEAMRMFEEADDFCGFTDAVSRLVLVLALIKRPPTPENVEDPNKVPQEASNPGLDSDASNPPLPPMTDLARYLFSFLTRSTPSFISLVQRNDPRGLLILFYYYRAVHMLLPEKQCWWSQKRAEYLGPAIERALQAADAETRMALENGKRLLEEGVPLWAIEAVRGIPVEKEQERCECLLAKIGLYRK